MTYNLSVENLEERWDEFVSLFVSHYGEMQARLERDGMKVSPFNPRKETYISANRRGDLLFFTVRKDGMPVGYATVYVTTDMHNQDVIAQEDTLYVLPPHRNGVGKKFVRSILDALREGGVKRANVSAMTDLRVSALWKRMGFKHTAHQMTYFF